MVLTGLYQRFAQIKLSDYLLFMGDIFCSIFVRVVLKENDVDEM